MVSLKHTKERKTYLSSGPRKQVSRVSVVNSGETHCIVQHGNWGLKLLVDVSISRKRIQDRFGLTHLVAINAVAPKEPTNFLISCRVVN